MCSCKDIPSHPPLDWKSQWGGGRGVGREKNLRECTYKAKVKFSVSTVFLISNALYFAGENSGSESRNVVRSLSAVSGEITRGNTRCCLRNTGEIPVC